MSNCHQYKEATTRIIHFCPQYIQEPLSNDCFLFSFAHLFGTIEFLQLDSVFVSIMSVNLPFFASLLAPIMLGMLAKNAMQFH